MKGDKRERWASETAMFAAFIAQVEPLGLRPYHETAGHDLVLLVTDAWQPRPHCDLVAGDQVAIEGKLDTNVHLLYQALPPSRGRWNHVLGHDFYAILAPFRSSEYADIARALGIVPIDLEPRDLEPKWHGDLGWTLPTFPDEFRHYGTRRELPAVRVQLPGGAAGSPSPRTATPWKIAAVQLCLRGTGAELTTADFKAAHHVRHRTFLEQGWMVPDRREGRSWVYRLVDHPTRPDVQFPEIVAALREAGQ